MKSFILVILILIYIRSENLLKAVTESIGKFISLLYISFFKYSNSESKFSSSISIYQERLFLLPPPKNASQQDAEPNIARSHKLKIAKDKRQSNNPFISYRRVTITIGRSHKFYPRPEFSILHHPRLCMRRWERVGRGCNTARCGRPCKRRYLDKTMSTETFSLHE